MNKNEYLRLYAHHKDNQRRRELSLGPLWKSKRKTKGEGKGVGQILRNSSIKSEVHMLECNPS